MTINQPTNPNQKKKKKDLITNRVFVSIKQNCIDTDNSKKEKRGLIHIILILICISFKGGKFHLKPPNRGCVLDCLGREVLQVSAIYKLSTNIYRFSPSVEAVD